MRYRKHTVISSQKLRYIYTKPGGFPSSPGKVETCLKQTGSRQRWNKNLHINASFRDDFENKGVILTELAL